MQYLVPRKNRKKNSDKVTCQNFDRSDQHTCIFIYEEINICWDTLSYTCLIAMTCNDIHLLLGQASFIRVFMICPNDCKKFAQSSCSVTKKIWKDMLVQKQHLLWGINSNNKCPNIYQQKKNPNCQRQPIMANQNEKIGYKVRCCEYKWMLQSRKWFAFRTRMNDS